MSSKKINDTKLMLMLDAGYPLLEGDPNYYESLME